MTFAIKPSKRPPWKIRLVSTDDLVLKEYQLLVKKSEKQLIHRLRTLAEKFDAGQFEAFSFGKLERFKSGKHLYQPLVHLSQRGSEQT